MPAAPLDDDYKLALLEDGAGACRAPIPEESPPGRAGMAVEPIHRHIFFARCPKAGAAARHRRASWKFLKKGCARTRSLKRDRADRPIGFSAL
jgi:hypothetical protein